MITTIILICIVVIGYLIGSISNATIVSKANDVDIFEVGSGNPGATNVKRAVGKGAGNLVFFLDMLKGFFMALWPFIPFFYNLTHVEIAPVILSLIGLTAALIGHSFSIFIGFRGGKGVATTIGGLLAIMAPVMFIGLIVWVIFFYSFRYVSLASIALAASLPIISFLFWKLNWILIRPYGSIEFYIALGIFILITVRHISNIKRLLNGTENKFAKKS